MTSAGFDNILGIVLATLIALLLVIVLIKPERFR